MGNDAEELQACVSRAALRVTSGLGDGASVVDSATSLLQGRDTTHSEEVVLPKGVVCSRSIYHRAGRCTPATS